MRDATRRLCPACWRLGTATALLTLALLLASVPSGAELVAPQQGMAAGQLMVHGLVQDAASRTPISTTTVTSAGVSPTTAAHGHDTLTVLHAATVLTLAIARGYRARGVSLSLRPGQRGTLRTRAVSGVLVRLPARTATVLISGVVRDAQSGRPIRGAVVATQGAQALADGVGHYQINAPVGSRVWVAASARGYRGSSWLALSHRDHSRLSAPSTFDFSGQHGLRNAFRTPAGDTLGPFPQVLPRGTKALTFAVRTRRAPNSAFGVIYPDGDAALLHLAGQDGRYTGRLPLDRGAGLYQVELLDDAGFSLFSVPLYVGVPYTPFFPPLPLPRASASATPQQMEAQTLALINRVRGAYHRAPLALDLCVAAAARAHSGDVLTHAFLAASPHLGSDHSTPPSRLQAACGESGQDAETIATGLSADEIVATLLASPWHRSILLSPTFRRAGLGLVRLADGATALTIDYLRTGTGPKRGGPLLASVVAGPRQAAVLSLQATSPLAAAGGESVAQRLQLLVPTGAVTGVTRFQASVLAPPLPAGGIVPGQPNNVALGFAFQLTASTRAGRPVRRFDPRRPLLLRISYQLADLGPLDPATLRVTFLDTSTGTWRTLPTTVDPFQQTLVALTTHVTLFQVRATARTPAQVRAAQARMAGLAAQGAPRVTVQQVLPGGVGGFPLLVTVPAGHQRAPLIVTVLGAPRAGVRIAFSLPGSLTLQSLSLDGHGYATTAFSPPTAPQATQRLVVSTTVSSGAASVTAAQVITVLPPLRRTAALPGAPPLQATLRSAPLSRGRTNALVTVATAPQASVRLVLLALHSGVRRTLVAVTARADRSGVARLRLTLTPPTRPPFGATGRHSQDPVLLVVTAALGGRWTQERLPLILSS